MAVVTLTPHLRRYWPLLLLVLGVLAVFHFLRSEELEDGAVDVIQRSERDPFVPPELEGLPASQREAYRKRQEEASRRRAPEVEPEAARERDPRLVVEGRVVLAESGMALPGTLVWWAFATEPCPRVGAPFYTVNVDPRSSLAHTGVGEVQAFTDPGGNFRLRLGKSDREFPRAIDLFAWAKGCVLYVECDVRVPGKVEISLERGLGLRGVVFDPQGRPVPAAVVKARPGPETPAGPGHATPPVATPRTDEEGRFELLGLLPGPVLVDVDHPHFVPATVGPHEPQRDGGEVKITLVPALRAFFEIRTDDGRTPANPTVVWVTTEQPPRSQVLLLPRPQVAAEAGADVEEETGEVSGGPVRIPCDAPGVVLQVKADGYATWRSEPIGLPSQGGKETFQVKLTGDLATGRLRISFENDRGEPVQAAEAQVRLGISRLDPGVVASAYVVRQREDLEVTDLPAGRYRLQMLSAAFAPATLEVEVLAGEETQRPVSVRPPAKLRIRVFGSGEMLVPFELQRGGQRLSFVPEGTYERRLDEETGQEITVAGPEGMLASGLEGGSCTVVVTSDEVYAPPTTVPLVEGETEEVDIEVRLR